jgi:hypothetical protein
MMVLQDFIEAATYARSRSSFNRAIQGLRLDIIYTRCDNCHLVGILLKELFGASYMRRNVVDFIWSKLWVGGHSRHVSEGFRID